MRLPSLFSNNLIFVAAGIEMAVGLELPTAGVAGMLLASTALDKLMNLTVFLGTSLADRYVRQPAEIAAGSPGLLSEGARCRRRTKASSRRNRAVGKLAGKASATAIAAMAPTLSIG